MNQSQLQGDWAEEIVDKYAQMVYRIAFSQTKNRHDADDIFQEVFLRLCRHPKAFDNDEHIKAWLIRVTINCCKNSFSSAWSKKTVPMPDDLVHEDKYQDFEIIPAIKSLPPKYSVVLHLFYFEDMAVADISKALKTPASTIKSRLSRARKLLRSKLEGGSSHEK